MLAAGRGFRGRISGGAQAENELPRRVGAQAGRRAIRALMARNPRGVIESPDLGALISGAPDRRGGPGPGEAIDATIRAASGRNRIGEINAPSASAPRGGGGDCGLSIRRVRLPDKRRRRIIPGNRVKWRPVQ